MFTRHIAPPSLPQAGASYSGKFSLTSHCMFSLYGDDGAVPSRATEYELRTPAQVHYPPRRMGSLASLVSNPFKDPPESTQGDVAGSYRSGFKSGATISSKS